MNRSLRRVQWVDFRAAELHHVNLKTNRKIRDRLDDPKSQRRIPNVA